MSSVDTHEKVIALFNAGDIEGIREYLADDVTRIDAPTETTASGVDEVLEMIKMWPKSFSDARVSAAEYLEGNSFSVALFNGEGTNDGEFGPFPPTGKTINVPFCEVAEFNGDGKLTRNRLYYDLASMLHQLGHMPAPDAS